jgi:hypothetical protein
MSRFNADKPTANELYVQHREQCTSCRLVDSGSARRAPDTGTFGRCSEGKKLVHAADQHLQVHSWFPAPKNFSVASRENRSGSLKSTR